MAPRCCAQFYKPTVDDSFKIEDYILKISYTRQVAHMFHRVYFRVLMIGCVGGMWVEVTSIKASRLTTIGEGRWIL
jgi:hypothetical protein